MAWLERDRPNGPFQVVFRYGNRRIKRSARTRDEREAMQLADRVERKLRMVEQGDLTIPEHADVITFLMSDGKLVTPPQLPAMMTLKNLVDEFFASLPGDAMEESSRRTARIHGNHLLKLLGAKLPLRNLGHRELQEYIRNRSQQPGQFGKTVSPVTIKKELATLSALWSFAIARGVATSPLASKGLRYPKTAEKPAFQTRERIAQQIAAGMPDAEASELWNSLFLTLPEVTNFLDVVRQRARHSFLYPMIALAADTGARRSELIRSQLGDIDLANNVVTLHERKRSRGRHTTRQVPLSKRLHGLLGDWFDVHPGGPHSFCMPAKEGHQPTALSVHQADYHFDQTLAGSQWSIVRGWHVLRHSFASNCASQGIDQRYINTWMGHQTEEMVRRYQHLTPDSQQAQIERLAS